MFPVEAPARLNAAWCSTPSGVRSTVTRGQLAQPDFSHEVLVAWIGAQTRARGRHHRPESGFRVEGLRFVRNSAGKSVGKVAAIGAGIGFGAGAGVGIAGGAYEDLETGDLVAILGGAGAAIGAGIGELVGALARTSADTPATTDPAREAL